MGLLCEDILKTVRFCQKGKKDKKYRGLYVLVSKNVQIFHDLTFIAQNIRHGCMKVICLNHIKAILLCKAFGESLEFFSKTNLYRSPAVIFVFFLKDKACQNIDSPVALCVQS